MKIKTFFYGLRNQEETEKEVNELLARQDITIEKILQSAASASCAFDRPEFKDISVAITVVYSEK